MRRHFRKLLPDKASLRDNRWLQLFGPGLFHPRLWHLNRRSCAGAVAVGLFCGMIPGPVQALSAAVIAMILKVNLPLAVVTTFYTNPLTIVPLYFAAFWVGKSVLGDGSRFTDPPDFDGEGFWIWLSGLLDWMLGLGAPLFLGLLLMGVGLAAIGYASVLTAWRWHIVHAWHKRRAQREAALMAAAARMRQGL